VIAAHEHCVELIYRYREPTQREWRSVHEHIPLDVTEQHFGGERRCSFAFRASEGAQCFTLASNSAAACA
jgi:hypothetical protein